MGLTRKLKSDYSELENVRINDIRLTGNEKEINVNIDVDLDDYDDEWEVLTDNKIKNWLTDMFVDIQDYYSEDTIIGGRIRDIDSKDVLVEFSKHRFQASKINYKDKDYRHGRGLDIYDVEDNWKGEKFTIAGMRLNIQSIKYNTGSDEIDIRLVATEARAADWENADSDAARTAIKDICKNIANDFVHDATQNPKVVNVRLYDKIQTRLDNFKYYVKDDVLR